MTIAKGQFEGAWPPFPKRVARRARGFRPAYLVASAIRGATGSPGATVGRYRCALALCLSVAAGCAGAEAKPEPGSKAKQPVQTTKAEAIRVEVATLAKSEATLRATLPGEVEGSRDATLASAQGGPIDRVLVSEAAQVRKGQVLVHVDRALYRIQLQQVTTRLAQAKREVERAQGLGTALSSAERERRQNQVQSLETEVALAELRLQRATIRAPFSGVVADVHVEVGEVVAPAAPLLRLVRLDPVQVVLSVPDRDVVALSDGTEVEVRLPSQSGALTGKIARINPTGSRDTRAFRVEVEVDNPELRNKPGMIASVDVARTLAQDSVVIPQDWLVTRRDGVGVFLVQDGKARYVPVKAGRVVREQVVIDEGLSPGAQVVIKGHRQLADGDALIVARHGRCCTDGRAVFN